MNNHFRTYIEQQLLPAKRQPCPLYGQQVTVDKIASALQKIILRSLDQSSNLISISKVGFYVQSGSSDAKQKSEQELHKNQLFKSSVKELSALLFKLAYGHKSIIYYPKYQIQNIVGFYQLSKLVYHSEQVLTPKQLKSYFKQQLIGLLFTQKIVIFKDIYYRMEQSAIFKNFISQIFLLTSKRIHQMFILYGLTSNNLEQTCMLHIRSFIQKYHMNQASRHNSITNTRSPFPNLLSNSMKDPLSSSNNSAPQTENQNQDFLNSISIDRLIICFVYLVYRMSQQFNNIRMCKLVEQYYAKTLKWQKWKDNCRTIDFYNNYYLQFYLANKVQKIQKSNIQIDSEKADYYLAKLVENDQTILDNFVSSFQA